MLKFDRHCPTFKGYALNHLIFAFQTLFACESLSSVLLVSTFVINLSKCSVDLWASFSRFGSDTRKFKCSWLSTYFCIVVWFFSKPHGTMTCFLMCDCQGRTTQQIKALICRLLSFEIRSEIQNVTHRKHHQWGNCYISGWKLFMFSSRSQITQHRSSAL